jgi:predicted  nucleic acid-binding Zn-ribbon protein
MSGPAAIMREIHRLRRFAHDLQEQIDRGPRQLKAQQAKVARQEELQREGQEAIKKAKIAVHDKESQLKAVHSQVAKFQKQMSEVTSKKEYDALQAEINAARTAGSRLEDEILLAMTEVDDVTARLPELEKAVQQARQEYAVYQKEAAERQAGFVVQRDEALAKLKEVEATVPAAVKPLYDRVVQARGADAFAAVNGKTCSACYTEITSQMQNDLAQEAFVLCKSCGRILYLPA